MTKFVKARNVTLPLLKIKEGTEYVITMLTAMALRLSPLSTEVTAMIAPLASRDSSWRTSEAMAWEYLLAG